MPNEVCIIEEFHAAMGHIITVKNDRHFRVGQIITANGTDYIIKGIHMNMIKNPETVDLKVIHTATVPQPDQQNAVNGDT